MFKILIYIIIIVVILTTYIRYIEGRSIFFPMKRMEFTPDFANLPYEDVYITTQDNVKINGWFIPGDNAKYTLLFCHGNAGNISHRLEKIIILRDIGVNIFIIDYRGYGNSEGSPSEKGLYIDARAAYDYLVNTRKNAPENIIIYGESLGGAVAVDLASKVKAGALIAEGTFSSARDMAKKMYPFLPALVFSSRLDSVSKIKKVGAPKLFIHSKNDEIVPFILAIKLYNAAGEPKDMIELFGGHNTYHIDSKNKYISSIAKFLSRL
ncbi:MAG: alpha/beta hydrolase [Candidatus Omnitrophota bacterium]